MRMPVYLICAALVVAIRSEEHAGGDYYTKYLEPVDMAADQETINYLIPKLAAKYRPNNEWSDVSDPRFYVLTDMDTSPSSHEANEISEVRSKRAGGLSPHGSSLSIVNSLDVLRNRLLLEIARKKAKEGASRNRQILLTLGKRSFYHSRPSSFDNNV